MIGQKRFLKTEVVLILLVSFLFGSVSFAENEPHKKRVLTTTGIVADLVKNVVPSELVEVEALMGPGVDPHLYKPTHKDISRLRNADIIVYNGLTLEGKLEPILSKLKKKKKVIAVTNFDRPDLLLAAKGYKDAFDPHIWFDLQLWSLAAIKTGSQFATYFPNHSLEIIKQTSSYVGEIVATDEWVKEQISLIPKEQRVLVTAHDAFRYMGKRYGVEVRGLQGISTAVDYGLRDVKELSTLIFERKLKAIFMESSVSAKFIESLQKSVQARGHQVKIGGTLYSDALGPAGSGADTYLSMVRSNTEAITKGLR